MAGEGHRLPRGDGRPRALWQAVSALRLAVQRIVYAANEANYCATCQTEGRLLADRALSKLLKKDWPRTLDELERRRSGASTS